MTTSEQMKRIMVTVSLDSLDGSSRETYVYPNAYVVMDKERDKERPETHTYAITTKEGQVDGFDPAMVMHFHSPEDDCLLDQYLPMYSKAERLEMAKAYVEREEGMEETEAAHEIVDGREDVYGDPVVQMKDIATGWSILFSNGVTPESVPLAMMWIKMVRAKNAPDYSDNPDDIEGYLEMYRRQVGENMIEARSVAEYLAKKRARKQSDLIHKSTDTLKEAEEYVEAHLKKVPRDRREVILELAIQKSQYQANRLRSLVHGKDQTTRDKITSDFFAKEYEQRIVMDVHRYLGMLRDPL